jgi:hypothetical protein
MQSHIHGLEVYTSPLLAGKMNASIFNGGIICIVYRLNDEIIDLWSWLKPTAEEIGVRRGIYQMFAQEFKTIWPSYEVHIFGSVATNSFLPTSGIL